MTFLFADSFDFYSSRDDATTFWDLNNTINWQLTTGRFSGSRAFDFGNGGSPGVYLSLQKSSGSNDVIHHIVLAFCQNFAVDGSKYIYVSLSDITTAQCSIVFQSDGSILLTSGNVNGTTLATYANAFVPNIWSAFEFEITINDTTGTFHVRKNGNAVDNFASIGLNTRGGTTNNYANTIQIGFNTPGYGTSGQLLDDFLWFNTTGSAPNTWVGDVRAVQLMPISDVTKQFTPYPSSYTQQYNNSTSYSYSTTANIVNWIPITSTYHGILASLVMNLSASATGHAQMALYDSTGGGGGPGNLLSTSAVITNPTSGLNTFSVSGGAAMTTGTTYWAGVLSDVTLSIYGNSNIPSDTLSVTYSSGFPATGVGFAVPGNINGLSTMGFSITPDNSLVVSESQEDGDTTYAYTSTVANADLYDIASLTSTPGSIVAVQTRAFMRKSDSGTRSGQLQVKSGTTTVTSTPLLLSSNYQWNSRVDTVDPNTGAAWTGGAVNALRIGPVLQA